MASVVNERAVGDRRMLHRRTEDRISLGARYLRRGADGLRVSWGGIWGGVLVVMAVLILLTTLGLAVGISAVDPQQPDAQTLGTGAAVWAGISLLIALFIGGMVSTRIGMVYDKATGAYEGALVWVLSVLLALVLAGSGMGLLAGGAFKLIGGATQAIGTVVQGDAGTYAEGTVDQIAQRLNDPQTARSLSAATGIPEDQLRSDLSGIAQRVEQSRNDPPRAAAEAKQGVQNIIDRARSEGRTAQAAERVRMAASATAWITFAALVLSLLAAVLGAMAGRRRAAVVAGREHA